MLTLISHSQQWIDHPNRESIRKQWVLTTLQTKQIRQTDRESIPSNSSRIQIFLKNKETFSRIDHMVGQKNKFQQIQEGRNYIKHPL